MLRVRIVGEGGDEGGDTDEDAAALGVLVLVVDDDRFF
jgi:hypothetical protein